jgi:predicted ATPase/class 3 adenylate cyclase
MTPEQQQLDAAIAALESQRNLLGNSVVDLALGGLLARRTALAAGTPAEVAEQARKLVTVLFLDVAGSTQLSQHLDPEDTGAVMDALLAACTGIVEAHQGKVLQYAGDSLLAVFGAELAQENDAERAVRAGLALLAEGARHGQHVLARHGHSGFNVRVGLHTGGVLLGGGVDAENSIRGITVNIAARMEQTAPAGALRISHDTFAHVRGLFDVEVQAPMDVKGVDVPIATYLVLRARPRAFRAAARGIEGVTILMIGRDAELERLQLAFAQAQRESRLVCVTVAAEAGMGKSRLLHEFQAWAEQQPGGFELFQGRAHPQTRHQPYGLLREVLAWRFHMADGDSMQAAKLNFEAGMAVLVNSDEALDPAPDLAPAAPTHLLGHLIGLDYAASPHVIAIRGDGRQLRARAFHAAAQVVREVARRSGQPLLMLLDDLHWSDDGSLDFLTHLLDANRDLPMLMVGLTRPELYERRPDWPGHADAQRIDLQPLAQSMSHRLAGELLRRLPEVPDALRELVTGAAEGNPFYMEELIKMLVDEGAITVQHDGWALNPDKLRVAHLPQTLTGVLQARLDAADPAEKLALQQAAVIGFVFWDLALAAIDTQAAATLAGVTQRALVVPHAEAGFSGTREFAFSHQLLHQVTYDTVLKRLRRSYHAMAGAWLARQSGARANDFLAMTAEHFEKAGEPERACEYLARAAEHAEARYAHHEAIDQATRGLALLADEPATRPLRWRLLASREASLGLQGQRSEQRADITALEQLANDLADDRLRFEAIWRRADMALRVADYRGLEQAARHAIELGERVGDESLRLRAQQRLGIALSETGSIEAGKALIEDTLTAARAAALPRIESLCLNVLSIIASVQDDPMHALHIDQEKLLLDRALGNPLTYATTVANYGESWLQLGDHAQALHHLNEGLRLTGAVGNRAMQALILLNLSQLMLRAGDALVAEAHAREALAIGRAVQSPEYEARAEWAIGHAELAQGRYATARSAFERAQVVASAAGLEASQLDAAAGLVRVALLEGDVPSAQQIAQPLLAHLASAGHFEGIDGPRLAHLVCCEVLARTGDARAEDALEQLHTLLQARAVRITEGALRDGFLGNIPEHRHIVAMWAAHHAAARAARHPR